MSGIIFNFFQPATNIRAMAEQTSKQEAKEKKERKEKKKDKKERRGEMLEKPLENELVAKPAFSLLANEHTVHPGLSSLFAAKVCRLCTIVAEGTNLS